MAEIIKELASNLNEFEDYFVVDSTPLEVCKLSRATYAKICKEVYNAILNRGYCVSQKVVFIAINLSSLL